MVRPEVEDNILHFTENDWDKVAEESMKQSVVVYIMTSKEGSGDRYSEEFETVAKANKDVPVTFIKFDVSANIDVCN